jgi:hypothetical protein
LAIESSAAIVISAQLTIIARCIDSSVNTESSASIRCSSTVADISSTPDIIITREIIAIGGVLIHTSSSRVLHGCILGVTQCIGIAGIKSAKVSIIANGVISNNQEATSCVVTTVGGARVSILAVNRRDDASSGSAPARSSSVTNPSKALVATNSTGIVVRSVNARSGNTSIGCAAKSVIANDWRIDASIVCASIDGARVAVIALSVIVVDGTSSDVRAKLDSASM